MATQPVAVTLCPPAPPDASLFYDQHLAVREEYPASKRTGIAMEDYPRMHTYTRTRGTSHRYRKAPEFVHNDTHVRTLLIAYGWSLIHSGRSPVPEGMTLETLQEGLEFRAKLALWKLRQRKDKTTAAWKAAGENVALQLRGILGVAARCMTLSWKLGWDSPAIAAEMKMSSPQQVRRLLFNLLAVARKIGLPVGFPVRPPDPAGSAIKGGAPRGRSLSALPRPCLPG